MTAPSLKQHFRNAIALDRAMSAKRRAANPEAYARMTADLDRNADEAAVRRNQAWSLGRPYASLGEIE